MKKIWVLAAVVGMSMVNEATFGQHTYTWNSSTRQVWVRGDNWTGGAAGKTPGVGANTSTTVYGTANDIALFGAVLPNLNTSLINFGTSTNNGSSNNSAANGTLALGAIGLTNAATSSLTVQNSSTISGVLTLNGATLNSIGNTIIRNQSASNLTFSDGSSSMGIALGNVSENVIQIDGTGNVSIGSIISGAARSLSLRATGSGSLILSGTNTYTGGTTVSSGTLKLDHATNTLANSGAVTVSGGTLALGGNSDTVGAVTLSSGSITSSTGVLTGSSYSLNDAGSISAILGGSGALTKTGAGTATLSGDNTYSGTTTINDGVLIVNGTHSGGGAYTVNTNGTLGGNGNITTAAGVTVAGGTLAAGTSIGALTITGDLSFTGITEFNVEMNTTGTLSSDLVTVTGALDLGTGTKLELSVLGADSLRTVGETLTIASYGSRTGFFSNFANNQTFTFGANEWKISYGGGPSASGSITLTAVPEPSALLLVGSVLGVSFFRRRRA